MLFVTRREHAQLKRRRASTQGQEIPRNGVTLKLPEVRHVVTAIGGRIVSRYFAPVRVSECIVSINCICDFVTTFLCQQHCGNMANCYDKTLRTSGSNHGSAIQTCQVSCISRETYAFSVTRLEFRGNYNATSNSMNLVHWSLMGGLLHLVQRGWDWVRPQPSLSPPRCIPNVTTYPSTASVPITVLLYNGPWLCGFNVPIKC